MLRAWWIVMMLGCAGGPREAPVASSPVDRDSCKNVAGHIVDLMTALAKDAPPEKIKQTHDLFALRCDQDLWSVRLRRCLVGVSSLQDGDRCNELMTDAQRDALNRAMGVGGSGG